MQKVVEAIGPFPGDSETFLVLETPQVLRILGCQVLGAGDTGCWGCCALGWWILETLGCWRCWKVRRGMLRSCGCRDAGDIGMLKKFGC